MPMRVNIRELAGGAMFVAIGAFFALNAWFGLRIGQAFSMGPGYFPIVLGLVLIGLGLAVAAGGRGRPAERLGPVPWRGIVLVTAAVVFFAFAGRKLGLAPSLAVATFMAAMAPQQATLVSAALLSLALTAFCVAVFVHALGLPYPVIGPWLGG
jgi:hypothetical protein